MFLQPYIHFSFVKMSKQKLLPINEAIRFLALSEAELVNDIDSDRERAIVNLVTVFLIQATKLNFMIPKKVRKEK